MNPFKILFEEPVEVLDFVITDKSALYERSSSKFFTEKLGFRVMTDQPFGKQRWIELGIPGADSQIVLFTPEGHENRIGGFQPIAFWTDDVFATAKILKSKGVEFAVEPKKEPWGTT